MTAMTPSVSNACFHGRVWHEHMAFAEAYLVIALVLLLASIHIWMRFGRCGLLDNLLLSGICFATFLIGFYPFFSIAGSCGQSERSIAGWTAIGSGAILLATIVATFLFRAYRNRSVNEEGAP